MISVAISCADFPMLCNVLACLVVRNKYILVSNKILPLGIDLLSSENDEELRESSLGKFCLAKINN